MCVYEVFQESLGNQHHCCKITRVCAHHVMWHVIQDPTQFLEVKNVMNHLKLHALLTTLSVWQACSSGLRHPRMLKSKRCTWGLCPAGLRTSRRCSTWGGSTARLLYLLQAATPSDATQQVTVPATSCYTASYTASRLWGHPTERRVLRRLLPIEAVIDWSCSCPEWHSSTS